MTLSKRDISARVRDALLALDVARRAWDRFVDLQRAFRDAAPHSVDQTKALAAMQREQSDVRDARQSARVSWDALESGAPYNPRTVQARNALATIGAHETAINRMMVDAQALFSEYRRKYGGV